MSTTVRELQLALLEMAVAIDEICRKYKIQYSLSSGTILGAVRHGGFIPWDDDLDIMLVRGEYERFLQIPDEEFKRYGFTIQRAFTEEWPMFFSKVRKDGTTFIEKYPNKLKGSHQGIYIDIFPVDNLYDSVLMAHIQWNAFHILAAKCLEKRGYYTNSLSKKIAMLIARISPEKILVYFVEARRQKQSKNVHIFMGASVERDVSIYPRSMFEEYTEIIFEGRKFSVVKDYENYLQISYGNYMKLPPEEERQAAIHARFVDLNKSYEEYAIIKRP